MPPPYTFEPQTPDCFDGPQNPIERYLTEITQFPLLTRQDEVYLAQKIERGKKASDALAHTMDLAKRTDLEERIETGNTAFEKLVQSNLRLVVSRAKKQMNHRVPLLDLIQEGNLGLIHAIGKFDWKKGFKFSTYAVHWIDHYITRALQNQPDGPRIPVWAHEKNAQINKVEAYLTQELGRTPELSELAVSAGLPGEKITFIRDLFKPHLSLEKPLHENEEAILSETLASPNADGTDELAFTRVNRERALELLAEAMPNTQNKERDIKIAIARLLGEENGKELTLEEIARRYGLTRERVRQVQRKILDALKNPKRRASVALIQFAREGVARRKKKKKHPVDNN